MNTTMDNTKDYESEFVNANNYTLKCMRVAFIVLLLSWTLNMLHIFIIDQTLMDRAFIGTIICLLLGYVVRFLLGFEKKISNYIMLFLLVAQISFANVQLAYHGTLFMIFPMVCSVLYNEDKYKIYTFILTAAGFMFVVLAGYNFGLCDANMMILTTTTKANTANSLLSGDYQINSDVVSLVLFYVFPRVITLFAFNSVLNYIKNSIREKTMKEQESRQLAETEKLANQAKSSFLANMSHEIRTPINTVLGLDTMILRESDDANIRKYALNIQSAGHSLLSIINDILDFSKIESGKMEIIPVEYEMASLISDVTNMIAPKADDKGLTLNVRADESIPAKLYGDDVRIRQVLINLLTNAVKYTPEGEVTLTVEWTRHGDEAVVHYSVKDTGIGIAKEDLEKLFQEFVRIEEKRNRNIEGTGLGINIVTMLLNLMDSKLMVDSVYGEGSDFYFALVQRIVDDSPIGDIKERIASMADEYSYSAAYRLPEVSLLVVDDNAMNRLVFTELLKDLECDIDEADSGRKCLELVADKKYDIIFMDHLMPQMDGIETFHRMQEMGDYINKDTPVIILTANAISGAKESYLHEGFDDFLSKPVDPDKLEKMILSMIPDDKKLPKEKEEAGKDTYKESKWYDHIEGIDSETGIKNSASEELFRSLLEMFYESIQDRFEELEGFYLEEDWDNYAIKIHALKSSARLVGALELGDKAQLLEGAGKAHDAAYIHKNHPAVMKDYVGYREILKKVFPKESVDDSADQLATDSDALDDNKQDKPVIEKEQLHDIYEKIRVAADEVDSDTIDELLKELSKYSLSEEDAGIYSSISRCVANYDYDGIIETLV